jgi:putative transposase
VEGDGHFLCVCRYVERNALTANLVARAEDWRWGGLWRRLHGRDGHLISDWPVPRPIDWVDRVNQPLTEKERDQIRRSIRRGCPLGTPDWARVTAQHLGLEHTLRPIGRPRIATAR